MTTRILFMVALVVACAHCPAVAQELATDAERTYRELRNADDARSRLLADRWYNLIRLQEWNDASGKFATTAKYVDHDPELAWVKLRVIRGTGANRVVKDVEIPVAKLSKTCQSRVRQISVLSDKVKTAAAEVGKEKEEDEDAENGEGATDRTMPEAETSRDEMDGGDRGERPSLPDATLPQAEPAAAPPATVGPVSHMPLPGQSPSAEQAETPGPAAAGDSDLPPLDPEHPLMPDNDPWRTDYEAFRTVFERDEDGIIVTAQRWWGVVELQAAIPNEFLEQDPNDKTPQPFVESRRAQEIGDFIWEATVAKQPTPGANWADVLALPPLPEPIRLELRVASAGGDRAWQILGPGDQVKFIGRFIGYKGAYTWVAEITAADASFVGDLTKPDWAEATPTQEPLSPPATDPDRPVE